MPAKTKAKAEKASSKPSTSLIDGKVSTSQVEKALSALAKHREKSRQAGADNELPLDGAEGIDGEGSRVDRSDVVWLQLTVKRLNANAPVKAVRLPLPHAVWPKSSSVCLLTGDPQRKYKDLMVEEKLTQVKRVVGVTKLKGKFRPFDARRQLMNDHEVFLADDRITPMLTKLLGKKWMQDRKSPIPVKLTKTKNGHLTKEITMALASTYFYRNKGTCSSIRLGTLAHLKPEELAENVAACLPLIVAKHVKGGWDNVQSIDIKTGSSAALPVWNTKLDDRWIGMPEVGEIGESDDGNSEDDEEDSESEEEPKSKKTTSKDAGVSSKKKRTAEEETSISKAAVTPKAVKKSRKSQ